MINLCYCPELNYTYKSEDCWDDSGTELTFVKTDKGMCIEVSGYYETNCGIPSFRLPIKYCPFCGKNFSE